MHALTTLCTCQTTLIQPSSAAAERVFSLLANSFNSNQESALEYYIQASCYARNDWNYGLCVGALWSIMGGVWEHYGWCVGALWVVCGSIRERNYRLKKKNYLSGPTRECDNGCNHIIVHLCCQT